MLDDSNFGRGFTFDAANTFIHVKSDKAGNALKLFQFISCLLNM